MDIAMVKNIGPALSSKNCLMVFIIVVFGLLVAAMSNICGQQMWMFVAIQKDFTIEFAFAASKTFFVCVPNPPSVVHVSAFADCVGLTFDGHLVIAVFNFDCSCHNRGVFGCLFVCWCKHTTKFRIHNT